MSSLLALLSLNSLSVFSFLVLPHPVFAVLDGIAEFDWFSGYLSKTQNKRSENIYSFKEINQPRVEKGKPKLTLTNFEFFFLKIFGFELNTATIKTIKN